MDISQSPAGKIVISQKGYRAFVPHDLPPTLVWDREMLNCLYRATFLLGKLSRECGRLPNPHLLIRPFIAREAVLSSKIEGTQATLGEILAAQAGIDEKKNPDDLQEVQNYIKALDYGLKRLEELPLSLRLIKEIHWQLMQGVRGAHATPGEFRTRQNWIGPHGCTLNTAKFVPPPPENLINCLETLEKFLHDRSLPPLVHIALCHYQFEAIHPFLDGNGRIGRLLITLLLLEQKILPSPVLYLSAFFEATREEYYKQLYHVSAKGTWRDWLIYFLHGVEVQSEDVLSRAERITDLLNQWKIAIATGGSQLPMAMIQHLAINPYFTTTKMAKDLKISYPTAQRGVLKLENAGIITKMNPHNKRDKIYCATEILRILEEPTNTRQTIDE